MMTAELMVGDWVFNKHHNKAIRITPYDFFTHGHRADGSQYLLGDTPTIGKDLEPIPITEEILNKNGFYREDFYSALDYNGEYRVLCDGHQVAIFHKAHTEINIPIEGVHELQHALRLCRIKKEIVL